MSCIDLIITDQTNLFVDFGIHSSLDEHCQQIIHGKLNISVPFPPRKVWYYAKAPKDRIKSAVADIDWPIMFSGLDVDKMTHLFTSRRAGIFSESIPNKTITHDNRDPSWMTPSLKSAIKRKHREYNKCAKHGCKPDDWEYVRTIRDQTSSKITQVKNEYFSSLGKKLSDPTNGTKSYWTTLNKIINKQKIFQCTTFTGKWSVCYQLSNQSKYFITTFVEKCSPICNDSVLPNSVSRCNSSLFSVEITGEKILSIIRSLDPKKAHDWDNISINMIKLCDIEIVKPLYLIYTECLETGRFPSSWKNAIVLPIHKQENRQLKKNYRPISLLPPCRKIFESLMFDAIYEHLCPNQLLTPNHSGFRPGDSTVNQLLSITHQIYSAFEELPSRDKGCVFRYIQGI